MSQTLTATNREKRLNAIERIAAATQPEPPIGEESPKGPRMNRKATSARNKAEARRGLYLSQVAEAQQSSNNNNNSNRLSLQRFKENLGKVYNKRATRIRNSKRKANAANRRSRKEKENKNRIAEDIASRQSTRRLNTIEEVNEIRYNQQMRQKNLVREIQSKRKANAANNRKAKRNAENKAEKQKKETCFEDLRKELLRFYDGELQKIIDEIQGNSSKKNELKKKLNDLKFQNNMNNLSEGFGRLTLTGGSNAEINALANMLGEFHVSNRGAEYSHNISLLKKFDLLLAEREKVKNAPQKELKELFHDKKFKEHLKYYNAQNPKRKPYNQDHECYDYFKKQVIKAVKPPERQEMKTMDNIRAANYSGLMPADQGTVLSQGQVAVLTKTNQKPKPSKVKEPKSFPGIGAETGIITLEQYISIGFTITQVIMGGQTYHLGINRKTGKYFIANNDLTEFYIDSHLATLDGFDLIQTENELENLSNLITVIINPEQETASSNPLGTVLNSLGSVSKARGIFSSKDQVENENGNNGLAGQSVSGNNGPAGQSVSGNNTNQNEFFDAPEKLNSEGENIFYDAKPPQETQLIPIGSEATSGNDIDIDKNLKLYNSITKLLESGQITLPQAIDAQLTAKSLNLTEDQLKEMDKEALELMLVSLKGPTNSLNESEDEDSEDEGDEGDEEEVLSNEFAESEYNLVQTGIDIEDLIQKTEEGNSSPQDINTLRRLLDNVLRAAANGNDISRGILGRISGKILESLRMPAQVVSNLGAGFINLAMRFLRGCYNLMPSLYEDIIPIIEGFSGLVRDGSDFSYEVLASLINGFYSMLPSIPDIRAPLFSLINGSGEMIVAGFARASSLSGHGLRTCLRFLRILMQNAGDLSGRVRASLGDNIASILNMLGGAIQAMGKSGYGQLCTLLRLCRNAATTFGLSLSDMVSPYIPSMEDIRTAILYAGEAIARATSSGSRAAARAANRLLSNILSLIKIMASSSFHAIVRFSGDIYRNILAPLGNVCAQAGASALQGFINVLRVSAETGGDLLEAVADYCQNEGLEHLQNFASMIQRGAYVAGGGLYRLITSLLSSGIKLGNNLVTIIYNITKTIITVLLEQGGQLGSMFYENLIHYGTIMVVSFANYSQRFAIELYESLKTNIPLLLNMLGDLAKTGAFATGRTLMWLLTSLKDGTIEVGSAIGSVIFNFITNYGPVIIQALREAAEAGSRFAGQILLGLFNILSIIMSSSKDALINLVGGIWSSLQEYIPILIRGLLDAGIIIVQNGSALIIGGISIAINVATQIGIKFIEGVRGLIGVGGSLFQGLFPTSKGPEQSTRSSEREQFTRSIGPEYNKGPTTYNDKVPQQSWKRTKDQSRQIIIAGQTRNGTSYTNPDSFPEAMVLRPGRAPGFRYSKGGYRTRKHRGGRRLRTKNLRYNRNKKMYSKNKKRFVRSRVATRN